MIVYEPIIDGGLLNTKVINNLNDFKNKSDVIVANRMTDEIMDVKDKVYTRDLFNTD